MSGPVIVAHLSDPHLPPLPWPMPAAWGVKRVLGMLNWWHRRRHQHSAAVLARLVDDLANQAAHHICVTGDLVNIGLPEEHAAAAAWLATLGDPARVTAVPGNHDIYAEQLSPANVGHWWPHMTELGEADRVPSSPVAAPDHFPFLRRHGRLAIIGLNSAVPTPPFHATGLIGPQQLARLEALLARLGAEHATRIVLIHHPPLPGLAGDRCALVDAEDLAGVLARHGPELVLHGHNHRTMLSQVQGPLWPVPVVGAASASMTAPHGRQSWASYNLFLLPPEPGHPIEWIERGVREPDGPVVELGRRRLTPGPEIEAERSS